MAYKINRGERKLIQIPALIKKIQKNFNPKWCSSIDQVLNLLIRDYQFKFHKPQNY